MIPLTNHDSRVRENRLRSWSNFPRGDWPIDPWALNGHQTTGLLMIDQWMESEGFSFETGGVDLETLCFFWTKKCFSQTLREQKLCKELSLQSWKRRPSTYSMTVYNRIFQYKYQAWRDKFKIRKISRNIGMLPIKLRVPSTFGGCLKEEIPNSSWFNDLDDWEECG